MNTLLVEDDASLRDLLARLLERHGHRVQAFETADAAWAVCQAQRFDVAVLDWMLPGMSGLELCRRLRSQPSGERTLVIVLTGRSGPEDLEQVLAAGADDYWRKPIDVGRLQIRLSVAERQARNLAGRGRVEDALRESVERFELVAQGTDDGIYDCPLFAEDWLAADAPVWYSARYKSLLGYRDDEFPNVRRSWMDHLHPEDRARVLASLSRHLADGTPYDVEYRLRTKSGEYRWFSGRAHAQWDDQGRPVRLAGAIRDITDRKRMEAAVQNDQRLLRQLLDVHERERQLLAYEIHDGLIQQIAAAKMHLEAHAQCAGSNAERAAREFELGLSRLREAVGDARRLLSGLRPPILDEAGVIAAIEYLANEQRSFVPEVVFQHDVSFRRLAPPLESAIFRIVQEALTNVRRHSQAHSVRIVLAARDGHLRLEIHDDGIGFAQEKISDANFGLRGIRERARLLGGGASIRSAPAAGTQVSVEFPLPAEAEEWS